MARTPRKKTANRPDNMISSRPAPKPNAPAASNEMLDRLKQLAGNAKAAPVVADQSRKNMYQIMEGTRANPVGETKMNFENQDDSDMWSRVWTTGLEGQPKSASNGRVQAELVKLAQEYEGTMAGMGKRDPQRILDDMERIAGPRGLDVNDYLGAGIEEDKSSDRAHFNAAQGSSKPVSVKKAPWDKEKVKEQDGINRMRSLAGIQEQMPGDDGADYGDDEDAVVFRKFPEGDLIAIFPNQPEGPDTVNSYQTNGQHGEASLALIHELEPATPQEHGDLAAELGRIGYNITVILDGHSNDQDPTSDLRQSSNNANYSNDDNDDEDYDRQVNRARRRNPDFANESSKLVSVRESDDAKYRVTAKSSDDDSVFKSGIKSKAEADTMAAKMKKAKRKDGAPMYHGVKVVPESKEAVKETPSDKTDKPMSEQEQMREWSNSVYSRYEDKGHVMDQPKGETVDLSLRRYLDATPAKVTIEESHTPKKLTESYRKFKAKKI